MEQKDILVELKRTLNNYMSNVARTETVFIGTLDGHLLLERNREEYPVEEITPMAGSVLGISDTIASQLLQQKLQDNIIIMDKNILGLFKVLDKEDSLFLGVVCDRLVNIGKMITFAKSTTKEINVILEEQNLI